MGLENPTFTDDLVTTNPETTDSKTQGDDHLRAIKTAIKNTIKRATRAFYIPGSLAKSANYTVLAADDNYTIVCDTSSAGFTLTLPSLAASDAGWCVHVLKTTTDANPVWIAPPSGTINGFTKVRRSVANHTVKVSWTGSVFVVQRQFGVPIGSIIPCYNSTLEQGCLWPDGTTFTAADFVELNSKLGGNTKPDVREYFMLPMDNSAGVTRVTDATSGVDGDTKGDTGGAQTVTLAGNQIPALTITVTDPGHVHGFAVNSNMATGGGIQVLTGNGASANSGESETGISAAYVNASQQAVNKMPPTIVVPHMMVAE